ncbi:MAG: hypothetical protein DI551_05310 [Micavibrio aeruginosavorus]|uniref:Uncharacterized protein n=1 Tax=Micavibrio aeruginosavorus TaxID=349221 RepID=A0A2W5MZT5_9BACT|nr:MAG: hypothetical protein DI551_05310 [Micavibrio aeruginosavorus]
MMKFKANDNTAQEKHITSLIKSACGKSGINMPLGYSTAVRKEEAFIILENEKSYQAIRIVASPDTIEEERKMFEETGRYESVTVTKRVG